MYGNPNAMYKLGDMYYHGYFVDKDIEASFYWYSFAKEQESELDIEADEDYEGFLSASIAMRMGHAYLFCEGTEIDLIGALLELRKAEELYYRQVLLYDDFSIDQLPKVQELIKKALDELNMLIM